MAEGVYLVVLGRGEGEEEEEGRGEEGEVCLGDSTLVGGWVSSGTR